MEYEIAEYNGVRLYIKGSKKFIRKVKGDKENFANTCRTLSHETNYMGPMDSFLVEEEFLGDDSIAKLTPILYVYTKQHRED